MESNKIVCYRKNLIENVKKEGNIIDSNISSSEYNSEMAELLAKKMFPNNPEKENDFLNLLKNNTKIILDSILNNDNQSILVNGEVQSGKTSNLISSIDTLNNIDRYDLIIYFTGRLNDLNYQNSERFYNSFKENNNYIVKSIKDPSQIKSHTIDVSKKKTLLYSIIKYSDKYEALYKIIKENNIKTLIINDEGDDSTLAGLSKKFNDDILGINNKNKSITITATPFKNLIDHEDEYDDYIVLESSKDYSSINKFEYINLSNPINPEEENEAYFIRKSLEDWLGKIDGEKGNQFLINILNENDEHNSIYSFTNEIIENLASKNNGKVSDMAKKILFDQSVIIFNGENNEISLEDINSRNEITIIIGGMKLSRGITFEKLTGELITSFSKNKISAGSLLQKARWCGYRDESNTFVYMNDKLIVAFKELIELQNMTLKYKIGSNYKMKFESKDFKELSK